MAATREMVMDALLQRLQQVCGGAFAQYSRKFYFFDDVISGINNGTIKGEQFPFICTYDGIGFGGGINNWQQKAIAQPYVRDFSVTLVIYARLPGAGTPGGIDSSTPGMSVLTPLIEKVEEAFRPDDHTMGTLSLVSILGQANKVYRVWLEGAGHSIPGDFDPSGLAMQTIPVRVMLP